MVGEGGSNSGGDLQGVKEERQRGASLQAQLCQLLPITPQLRGCASDLTVRISGSPDQSQLSTQLKDKQ